MKVTPSGLLTSVLSNPTGSTCDGMFTLFNVVVRILFISECQLPELFKLDRGWLPFLSTVSPQQPHWSSWQISHPKSKADTII